LKIIGASQELKIVYNTTLLSIFSSIDCKKKFVSKPNNQDSGGQNREHRNTKIREWFKENFTKYANKNDEISRQKFIQACKSLPVSSVNLFLPSVKFVLV
jgi:hypothetical protein